MLCDLDLGSGQGHINIHSMCRTTSMPKHVTVASRTTEIWPFEWNIDNRTSLNSRDSFPIRKLKNRALTSCSCLPTFCVVHTVNHFDLWISKEYRRLAFKTMYVQFCNEAKSSAYWLVNETQWYETETFDFQSEMRSRPRRSLVSTRPRQDRDVWKLRLETVETETSRQRLHPCLIYT